MEEKTVKIEKVAKQTNGIMYDGGWVTVKGKAAEYVKDINPGDTYTVSENVSTFNGKQTKTVTFLRKVSSGTPNSSGKTPYSGNSRMSEEDQARVTRMNCFDKAMNIILSCRSTEEQKLDSAIQIRKVMDRIELLEYHIEEWVTSGDWPDHSDAADHEEDVS